MIIALIVMHLYFLFDHKILFTLDCAKFPEVDTKLYTGFQCEFYQIKHDKRTAEEDWAIFPEFFYDIKNFNYFENGRRPQFFGKCKTTEN
jgi:hypothetical protein